MNIDEYVRGVGEGKEVV